MQNLKCEQHNAGFSVVVRKLGRLFGGKRVCRPNQDLEGMMLNHAWKGVTQQKCNHNSGTCSYTKPLPLHKYITIV